MINPECWGSFLLRYLRGSANWPVAPRDLREPRGGRTSGVDCRTTAATPSTRRRFDGVVHHAFHLADMYLTPEAAAYAVTRLRPTSIGPSDPRETSGLQIDRSCSRLDHRGGIVLDANQDA